MYRVLLKKWETRDEYTHTGMPPTTGKWYVEDDNEFLDAISEIKGEWAITERVPDVSHMVFDIDFYVKQDIELEETGVEFIKVLRNVLNVHTDVYSESRYAPSEMYLLCKPGATEKEDGKLKAGFKVILPLDMASKALNKEIAVEMRKRISEWFDLETTSLPKSIVDTTIYGEKSGWLLYGSTKAEQVKGGYKVVRAFKGKQLKEYDPEFDEAEYRDYFSRRTIEDESRPVKLTQLFEKETLKRKEIDEQAFYLPTELKNVQRLLKYIPQCKLDDPSEWIKLACALKSAENGNTDWDKGVKHIFFEISRKSIHYIDDAWLLRRWANLTPYEIKQSWEYRIVNLACKWVSKEHLSLSINFIHAVKRILKPKESVIRDLQLEVKALMKYNSCNKQKKQTEALAMKALEYTLNESDMITSCDEVYKYISNFIVKVTDDHTSIVSIKFIELNGQYFQASYARKTLRAFLDGYKDIESIILGYLSSPECATSSGWCFDPEYRNIKRDDRFYDDTRQTPFNIFCGFAIDRVMTQEEARVFKYDEEVVEPFTTLIGALANNDDETKEYLLKFLAAPLQHRGLRLDVMLIIKSLMKGLGKSVLFSRCIGDRIYGSSIKHNHFFQAPFREIQDINHLVGDFNELAGGVCYIVCEECGIFDGAIKQNQKIKTLITSNQVTVNRKYAQLMPLYNSINMVLLTNKEKPIHVEPGDRRFFVLNSEIKLPREEFDRIVPILLHDDVFIKHLYAYLMQLPDAISIAKKEPPMTIAKRSMEEDNIPSYFQFLQVLVEFIEGLYMANDTNEEYEKMVKCGFEIWSSETDTCYYNWCTLNRLTYHQNRIQNEIRKLLNCPKNTRSYIKNDIFRMQKRTLKIPRCDEVKRILRQQNYWTEVPREIADICEISGLITDW